MDVPDGEAGTGDTPFAGTSTGQVHVGRYILDVPSPGGTTLSLAPRRARTDPPPALRAALAADTPDTRGVAERANQLLDTAEAVTDRVERVTGTVRALLEGRPPDPELISGDLLDVLGLMQRLDQSGRFAEVIKLGRPLCRLLALTFRWAALVEALRLVLHAATALADTPTTAWAQHELGTLHGSVGDLDRARELLDRAHATREAIGDEPGLAATDHNLKVLSRRAAIPTSMAALVGVGVVALIAAVLVFAESVGGGSSPPSVSTTTSTSQSSTSVSTSHSSTTSHSSSVPTDARPLAVRPTKLDFGTLAPGTTSDPQTITLVNTDQVSRTITSVELGGDDPTDFAISGCGGQTIAPQGRCTVAVTFTPSTAGPRTAALTFNDGADPSTQQVQLAGAGQSQTTSVPVTTTPTTPSTPTTTAPVTTPSAPG
jgi:Abnormal spindle-like microcephaly-assoc'd, ASPM-SPD-2-Hydin